VAPEAEAGPDEREASSPASPWESYIRTQVSPWGVIVVAVWGKPLKHEYIVGKLSSSVD